MGTKAEGSKVSTIAKGLGKSARANAAQALGVIAALVSPTFAVAEDSSFIADPAVERCVTEALQIVPPLTDQQFDTSSAKQVWAECVVKEAENAISAMDVTRLRSIWITVEHARFAQETLPDRDGLLTRLEDAAWSKLKSDIDTALADRDLTGVEALIRTARAPMFARRADQDGPLEGAGRFSLSVGVLWSEYRHGQDRLLLRLRPSFAGESGNDPCLRVSDVAILDQDKTTFRKGKNIRDRGRGGSGGRVGVGGGVSGGSRSGVGGGVGISVDVTSLFGGGGDGRVNRIFRMDGAAGPAKSWTIVGTFRNHCARTKETFTVPLVPSLENQQPVTTAPPLSQPPVK